MFVDPMLPWHDVSVPSGNINKGGGIGAHAGDSICLLAPMAQGCVRLSVPVKDTRTRAPAPESTLDARPAKVVKEEAAHLTGVLLRDQMSSHNAIEFDDRRTQSDYVIGVG